MATWLEQWGRGPTLDERLDILAEMSAARVHLRAMAADLGISGAAMQAVIETMHAAKWDRTHLTGEQRRHIMKMTGWKEEAVTHGHGSGPAPLEEERPTLTVGGWEVEPSGGIRRQAAATPEVDNPEQQAQKLLAELRAGYVETTPKHLAKLDEWLGLPRAPLRWRLRRQLNYYRRKLAAAFAGYLAAWLLFSYVGTTSAMFCGLVCVGTVFSALLFLSHLPAGPETVVRVSAIMHAAPVEPAARSCEHCGLSAWEHAPDDCPSKPETYAEASAPRVRDTFFAMQRVSDLEAELATLRAEYSRLSDEADAARAGMDMVREETYPFDTNTVRRVRFYREEAIIFDDGLASTSTAEGKKVRRTGIYG